MGNNNGVEPIVEIPLTPLPSTESLVGAAVQVIQNTEKFGGSNRDPGIYPDPVAGWDIGYGTQVVNANGQINSANLQIILNVLQVPAASQTMVTQAIIAATKAGGNAEAAVNAAVGSLIPGGQFALNRIQAATVLQTIITGTAGTTAISTLLNNVLNANGLSYIAGSSSYEYEEPSAAREAGSIDRHWFANLLGLALLSAIVSHGAFAQSNAIVPQPSAERMDDPEYAAIFMFAPPLQDNKEIGGFYVIKLSDGTILNCNLYYARSPDDRNGPVQKGSCWYPKIFDGRTTPITVIPQSPAGAFSFEIKSNEKYGSVDTYGWLSPDTPTDGHGNYLASTDEPSPPINQTLIGKMSADQRRAEGVWKDSVQNHPLSFTMERRFVYREIVKPWPFYEDVVKPVYAKFSAIFPDLPYPGTRSQVVKDASKCYVDGECENDISVVGISNGLLMLRIWQLGHSLGATAEYGVRYLVFSVNGDVQTRLSLDQVLDESGNCGARIESAMEGRLAMLLNQHQPGLSVTADLKSNAVENADSFIVSDIGVTLHYSPASLDAPFSGGEYFVTLKKDEFRNCFVSRN
jgi:hypothetical protein